MRASYWTKRHTIVRLDADLYVAWSSPCDAPAAVMTRADVEAGFAAEVEEAREALALAESRLSRLDTVGHTALWTDQTPRQYVAGNRAGDNECELSWDGLVAAMRDLLSSSGADRG
jgi:hypothetical protein